MLYCACKICKVFYDRLLAANQQADLREAYCLFNPRSSKMVVQQAVTKPR